MRNIKGRAHRTERGQRLTTNVRRWAKQTAPMTDALADEIGRVLSSHLARLRPDGLPHHDCLQMCWVEVMKSADELNNDYSAVAASTWLGIVVERVISKELRRYRRQVEVEGVWATDPTSPGEWKEE
jgi:DNA-directed RNA polymerase specialized sigma24 family protein